MRFDDITHPDDVGRSVPLKRAAMAGEVSSYDSASATCTRRAVDLGAGARVAGARQRRRARLRDRPDARTSPSAGAPRNPCGRAAGCSPRRRSSRSSGAGSGAWKPVRSRWSEELYRIFGLRSRDTTIASYSSFFERVHPDERRKVEAIIDRSLARREPFHEEMQIVRADGAVRIIDAHGEVALDADGKPDEDGRHGPGRDRRAGWWSASSRSRRRRRRSTGPAATSCRGSATSCARR